MTETDIATKIACRMVNGGHDFSLYPKEGRKAHVRGTLVRMRACKHCWQIQITCSYIFEHIEDVWSDYYGE